MRKNQHPLHPTWIEMRRRCNSKTYTAYYNHGAIGVTVAPEWDDFYTFVADIESTIGGRKGRDRLILKSGEKTFTKGSVQWGPAFGSNGNKKHPLYAGWKCMRSRCNNPKAHNYKHYGGRGISIAPEWSDFQTFANDVARILGPRKEGQTLDRINNDGGYTPDNIRWASQRDQSLNTRKNRHITLRGETKTLSEWAEQLKISPSSLIERLEKWPKEKALTQKRQNYAPTKMWS